MTQKKFVDLVYRSVVEDNFDIYKALFAVKDHYKIEDELFITFIKKDKTLKKDLETFCQKVGLLKRAKENVSIDNLF
jgi:hypothetical protein